MRVLGLALLMSCCLATPVFAGNVPAFLKGKVYSTDPAQCGDVYEAETSVLQLSKEGIYAEEFSCQFVDFKVDSDPQTGRVYGIVATANCSDDSGISRPDLLTLSPWEEGGEVIVQSQNEYLLAEAEIMVAQKLGQEIPEKSSFNWVSTTYKLCK